MKSLILVAQLLLVMETIAQQFQPPPRPKFAEKITWDAEKKNQITSFVKDKLTKALVIYHNSERVYSYGNTDQPYDVFSARKSFLSLLYGIYMDKGKINLETTLAELQIDD